MKKWNKKKRRTKNELLVMFHDSKVHYVIVSLKTIRQNLREVQLLNLLTEEENKKIDDLVSRYTETIIFLKTLAWKNQYKRTREMLYKK